MAEKKLTKEEKKRLKEGKKQAARRAKEAAKAEKIREKLARKEAKRAAKEAKKRGVKPADEVKEDETEKVVKTSAAPETPAPAETAPETEETVEETEDEEAEEDEAEDEKAEAAEKKAVNRPKNYHVSLREDGKWQVKFAKGTRALKLFDTQAEAIAFAKEKAENQDGTITIHKKDGKIRKQRYDK